MSMYKTFTTDANFEKNGIRLDYGDFVVTVGRSGGANKKFERVLSRVSKPHRRAIQTGLLDDAVGLEIMHQAYAEGAVFNWETKVGEEEDGTPKFEQGIEPPTPGEPLLPFTPENVIKTFRLLPELFDDIREQSNQVSLYRKEVDEEDAKNS